MLETPYYLINVKELDRLYSQLENALQTYWGNYIIGYSYKTNSLPWLISYMDRKGCYAEVVSEDEYELAKKIGVESSRFIYNGPIKSRDTFLEALQNRAYVNIDSQRELNWLKSLPRPGNYNLGIRVNFDIEALCPGESSSGSDGGRFGFSYENGDFAKALNTLHSYGMSIKGLHLHLSSKTRSLKIYEAISKMACRVASEYNLQLEYIDIGGGFFGGLENRPQFDDYMRTVSNILEDQFDPAHTKLIVEPGMALIGSPVSYVTSVIDIKETPYNRFVVTDGSRTSIDPLMHKSSYFHRYTVQHPENTISKQIIAGYTCMENDRFYTAINEPEFSVGDKIIFDKVGAYTMCLTPLFIRYFPAVYIETEDGIRKVRDRWSPENYMQGSILE